MKRTSNSLYAYFWFLAITLFLVFPSTFGVAFIFILTLITAYAWSKKFDKAFKAIFAVFLISYILRICVSFFLYQASFSRGLEGFFYGGDDYAYGVTALTLSDSWRAGVFPSFMEIKYHISPSGTMGFYQYYLTVLTVAFRSNVFIPLMLNVSLSSLSIIALYRLGKMIFPAGNGHNKLPIIACSLFAFWPSIVFWSSLNLKEPMTIFVILLTAINIIKLLYEKREMGLYIKRTVNVVFLLFLIYLLTRNTFFFVMASAGLTVTIAVLRNFIRNRKTALMISVFILLISIVVAFILSKEEARTKISTLFSELTAGMISVNPNEMVNRIDAQRDLRAFGKSVIFPDLRLYTVKDVLAFLPAGIAVALFYPLPWQTSSFVSFAAIPEMIIWYAFVPFLLRGILFAFEAYRGRHFFILIFTILYFTGLGLLESNSGTLFRHRVVALPFSFLLISAGLQKENIFKRAQ